jgi:hypothetical protein
VLLYRVFPWLEDAAPDESGGALYVHVAGQGKGRFDNPHLYGALYVAMTPAGAIGERLQNVPTWTAQMLRSDAPPGAELRLATLGYEEDTHPLFDLDDAKELDARGLRPSDVVKRTLPLTQGLAADIFAEGVWAGLTWWSMHRASWTLAMLWDHRGIDVQRIEPIPGHPGLRDAAGHLARVVGADLA